MPQSLNLIVALNSTVPDACRMALNFEMPQDGSAPEWLELLPAGQIVTGRDGRTWINDQPEGLLALNRGKEIRRVRIPCCCRLPTMYFLWEGARGYS